MLHAGVERSACIGIHGDERFGDHRVKLAVLQPFVLVPSADGPRGVLQLENRAGFRVAAIGEQVGDVRACLDRLFLVAEQDPRLLDKVRRDADLCHVRGELQTQLRRIPVALNVADVDRVLTELIRVRRQSQFLTGKIEVVLVAGKVISVAEHVRRDRPQRARRVRIDRHHRVVVGGIRHRSAEVDVVRGRLLRVDHEEVDAHLGEERHANICHLCQ